MDRKAIARETLEIMRQGYYEVKSGDGIRRIDVSKDMERSVSQSILITPKQGQEILRKYDAGEGAGKDGKEPGEAGQEPEGPGMEIGSCEKSEAGRPISCVENISTVDAIRKLAGEGKEQIGVLNFASAKNPGGGFINGAMAQEESLAASSTLYRTLTAHEEYYRENRAHKSMMYLDYGIYSPDVTFFRDGSFKLAADLVHASVLTLPAVNMGQVLQKGEDVTEAKRVMRRRMKLALAIFAEQGARNLVLGAYGCGVFRNDPRQVAAWWKEILEEGLGRCFESVVYAVLDTSKGQNCIKAFMVDGL